LDSKKRRILVTCISMPISFLIAQLTWNYKHPYNFDNSSYMFIVILLGLVSALIGFLDYKTELKSSFIWFCIGLLVVPSIIGIALAFTINIWMIFFASLLVGGIFLMIVYYGISMTLQKYFDHDNLVYSILLQLPLLIALTIILILWM